MAVVGRRASPFDFKRAWVEPPTVAKYYHSLDLVTLILETEVLFQEAALRDGPKEDKQTLASGYHVVRFSFCHSSRWPIQLFESLGIIIADYGRCALGFIVNMIWGLSS